MNASAVGSTGGAILGGYDQWFAVKIVDYGPGGVDRMGLQLSRTSKA